MLLHEVNFTEVHKVSNKLLIVFALRFMGHFFCPIATHESVWYPISHGVRAQPADILGWGLNDCNLLLYLISKHVFDNFGEVFTRLPAELCKRVRFELGAALFGRGIRNTLGK